MEQEFNKYWDKFLEFGDNFIDWIQQFVNYAQNDEPAWIILYVAIPTLLSLLILSLIISVRDRYIKRTNRKQIATPYDLNRVAKYNEDLASVVGEGNVMVEMLENEIRDSQHRITSLREEVDALQEERKNLKEEIRLMEEAPTELVDSLKRDNEQKLTKIRKKGNAKAFKMMVLGLFLGFLITGTASGVWIYDKHPDTVKSQVTGIQTYITSWLK